MNLLLLWVNVPAKVHITLDGPSWDDEVWVALRIDRSDVIFAIITSPQGVPSVIGSAAWLRIAFVRGRRWLVTLCVSSSVLSE